MFPSHIYFILLITLLTIRDKGLIKIPTKTLSNLRICFHIPLGSVHTIPMIFQKKPESTQSTLYYYNIPYEKAQLITHSRIYRVIVFNLIYMIIISYNYYEVYT
jgi:hypothetical protein